MKFQCPLCQKETAYRAVFNNKIIVCKCQGLQQVGEIKNGKFFSINKQAHWTIRKLNTIDSIIKFGTIFDNAFKNEFYVKNYYSNKDVFVIFKNKQATYMLSAKDKEISLPKQTFLSGHKAKKIEKEDLNDLFSFLISNKILHQQEKDKYLEQGNFNEF